MRRAAAAVALAVVAGGCGAAAREAAPLECAVHVYFCTADLCGAPASRAQIDSARGRFRARDDVWSVRFVSKAEALRRMKKRYPDEVARLPANPFPDSLVVRPVQGADRDRIAATVSPGRGGVQHVTTPHAAPCSDD